MAGNTDGPADVDKSTEHRGSAVGTPGLTALDEEREASLADEGGASGAAIESQDPDPLRRNASDRPVAGTPSVETRRRRPGFWVAAGALVVAAIGTLARRKRR